MRVIQGKTGAAFGFAVACCLGVCAEETAVGWREAVEFDAAAEASRLMIGEGGEAYKLGEGVGTLSLGNVNRQAPYAINVVSGRLEVVAGAAATPVDPPAFIGEKAAFWVDATSGCGLQTEQADGDTRVTRWCDRRESDPANRVYFSALPAHYATGHARENTANPLVTNVIGNACVSFGGVGSGQYMLFKTPADVTKAFTDVVHFFIVHGSYATWGAVLGYTENTGTGGFRANSGGSGSFALVPGSMSSYFDLPNRGDQHGHLYTARYAQNGKVIDPFRTPPLCGFELLDATMNEGCQTFNNFFRQRIEQYVVGGDYLSEVILFTNRLSAAEVARVEVYLMNKWNLTYDNTNVRDLSRDVGRVSVAANATVGVSPAAGEETGPLAFSGTGTVEKDGEGTLVIGPSGTKNPFAGTFSLKQGRVAVRGGSVPALAVRGGDVLDARFTSTANSPTLAAQLADGDDITLTPGAASEGTFRKTGTAEARVSSVADDVRRIAVEGGSLVLAAKTTEPDPLGATPITSVNVTIPNASFEDYFTDNPTKTTVNVTSDLLNYGWSGPNSNNLRFMAVNDGGWSTYCPAAKYAPEGRAALMLKTSGAYAYTTVTIDQPGEYEFSCCSTVRGTGGEYPLGIFFGSTWAAATQVGTILNGKTPWPRTFCRFTVAAAGDYKLGFKAISTTYYDNAYMIDALALRLVTEAKPTQHPVPNGDFESVVKGTTINTYPSTNMTLTGWTLDASGSAYYSGTVNSAVAAVSLYHSAYSTAKQTYLSPAADKTTGNISLLFIGTGGKATSAAFAPTAGTYQLKARAANWNSYYFDDSAKKERDFSTGVPAVKVTLVRADGESVDLGSVTPRGHLMSDCVWPVAFSVSADESVSLVVEQTTSNAAALVDDLTLVAADEADAGELVANGGLEVPFASDNFVPFGDTSGYICKKDRQLGGASGTAVYFGYNLYEGSYQAQIGCTGGLYETVTFPSAGLYRLRFAAHSRTSTRTSHGRNPLHAYLQTADGKSMVSDIVTVHPFGANYCEYSALFKVEAAGKYRFVIRGTSLDPNYKDRRSYVDGISIRKVVGTTESCPQMPADLRISVAEGALLQLDYTGTLRVRTLRIGGVQCSGTVSASTHPDSICGAGKIEIVPNGSVLILK